MSEENKEELEVKNNLDIGETDRQETVENSVDEDKNRQKDMDKTGEIEQAAEAFDVKESDKAEDGLENQDKKAKVEQKKEKSFAKKCMSIMAELLLYVVIALVCIFVIPKYVVQRTQVSGPSMEATLQDKDNILVEKLSYRFGKPERFDIIIFYHFLDPDNEDKTDELAYDFYVKRIIGLPGEKVQIIGDTIYINDQPLEEHYGKDPITYEGVAEKPIVLGDNEYFVLGDNREVSQDSRYEEVGNVREDLIVGRAWLRVYPFKKAGFLTVD